MVQKAASLGIGVDEEAVVLALNTDGDAEQVAEAARPVTGDAETAAA